MKRLLYIVHRLPYPPNKGERVRAWHELLALREHFDITVAIPSRGKTPEKYVNVLKKSFSEVLIHPAQGWLGTLIKNFGGTSISEGFFRSGPLHQSIIQSAEKKPFDLIMGYSSTTLPYIETAKSVCPNAKTIMDLVDVDSEKFSQYAEKADVFRRQVYLREQKAVRLLEQRAVDFCDAVLLVSQAEGELLDSPQNLHVIGNGVDLHFFSPDPPGVSPMEMGRSGLVFTGTMDYPPNIEAVQWFVHHVFHELRRELPAAKFYIVGRDPTPAVKALKREQNVYVTGAVDDVRPYVLGARVAVCPLRIGRGVQNKALEAMALGKPVLASRAALTGLDLAIGVEALWADYIEEWKQCLLYLLHSPDARFMMGQAARHRMEENYAWPMQMNRLVKLCTQLLETD